MNRRIWKNLKQWSTNLTVQSLFFLALWYGTAYLQRVIWTQNGPFGQLQSSDSMNSIGSKPRTGTNFPSFVPNILFHLEPERGPQLTSALFRTKCNPKNPQLTTLSMTACCARREPA